MAANGSQAMIPKARGIYAKRINNAEYEELMRRRTVPEIAALLKKHPYFSDSLKTLSTIDPHRGQIEELLQMDLFRKYEQIVHYDTGSDSFSDFFIVDCEVRELLKILHLVSIGNMMAYMAQIPPYLQDRLHIDLFSLAQARSFRDVVERLAHTPYQRVLRARYEQDPNLRNFPLTEAELLRYQYENTFRLARRSFTGRELQSVESMFRREAEIYNVSLILRVKLYFNSTYTAEDIKRLLLPYTFRIPKRQLAAMAAAPSVEAMLSAVGPRGSQLYGLITPEELDATGGRMLNTYARRLLHLTTSPAAGLAAFMVLARQEVENVTNVIEGVRYGLAPEKIRVLLRY